MALNNDMQDLITTVRKPIIFYFPDRIFPEMDTSTVKQLEEIDFLNTLLCLDREGEPTLFDEGFNHLSLLSKPKILKSNIFQLLEMKANLNEDTFLYLLKDYTKEVDTWVSVTDVIKKDAKTEAVNYREGIQSYLDFQHMSLARHEAELKTQFGKWKQEIELERVSKLFGLSPIMNSKPKENQNLSFNENNAKGTFEKKKIILNKPNKKRIYLTDEDVDKYLLKTVFNVKI